MQRPACGPVRGFDWSSAFRRQRAWAAPRATRPRHSQPPMRAWQLGWSRERLTQLAAGLGSDIPFFFGSGAADLPRPRRTDGAACGARSDACGCGSTAGGTAAPRRCIDIVHRPTGRWHLHRWSRRLQRGHWSDVGRHLHNRLEPAAERLTPWIHRLRSVFDRLDCLGHQMSGSGTSYYGICRNAGHARRVAARLRGARAWLRRRGHDPCDTSANPVTTSASEGGPHGNH